MRTNIEIDDKLMKQAMKASRLKTKTKKAVVEEALQILVKARFQGEIRKLRGRVKFWDGYPRDRKSGDKDKWGESVQRSATPDRVPQMPVKNRVRARKAA